MENLEDGSKDAKTRGDAREFSNTANISQQKNNSGNSLENNVATSADGYIMTWDQLLCKKRQRKSNSRSPYPDGRNDFEKDYHRIILSASFRRLQDKTQVFPLDQSDFVRTRLTHSLEVSSIAKSLGAQVTAMLKQSPYENVPEPYQEKEIIDILACAGLLHDMGNPPFGHYGETTIRNYYKTALIEEEFKGKKLEFYLNEQMKQDLLNFEGNAQVIRLVCKLHYLKDEYGMNLTYGLLNTLMKYPVNSLLINPDSTDIRYEKMGYFYAEKDLFYDIVSSTGTLRPASQKNNIIAQNLMTGDRRKPREEGAAQLSFAPDFGSQQVARHPLTYLLEAADDISYRTADIEDASRKGKISLLELQNALKNSHRINNACEKTRKAYFKVVQELDSCYEEAKSRHAEKASLYAIQNWLIYVQAILIESVSETFVLHYEEIMRGEYIHNLFYKNLAGLVLDVLGDIAYDYVFSTQSIVELEVAADAIITGLLDKFVPASINYDTEIEQKPVERRLMALISDNYRSCYMRESQAKSEGEKLYLRLLLVNDYICGMTDSFARDLYHKFNGMY